MLFELESLVPYDMGYLFLFDARGRLSCCETRHVDERRKRQYFDYYMHIDPCRSTTPMSARCMHTDWSRFRNTEFYADFGGPQGVRYSAGVQLHRGDGGLLGVLFLTRSGKRGFGPCELTLLEALGPPVENLLLLVTAAEERLLLRAGAGLAPLSGAGPRARAGACVGSRGVADIRRGRTNAAVESGVASATDLLNRLSPRERQIAGLLCRGHSTKAIASSLLLSPRTVYRHVSNIFEKAEVHSRGELVALVYGARER